MSNIDRGFGDFPALETRNLRLRRLTTRDAAAILDIFADEEVTRYYDLYTFCTIREAIELIDFMHESFLAERQIRWGIERKADGKLVGTCGFVVLHQHRGEIGYDLARVFWGHGYMREALGAVLAYGFHTLDLNRIEALVMPDNRASIRLLNALSFQNEGVLREFDRFKGAFHDLCSFSLLAREFGEPKAG